MSTTRLVAFVVATASGFPLIADLSFVNHLYSSVCNEAAVLYKLLSLGEYKWLKVNTGEVEEIIISLSGTVSELKDSLNLTYN